MKKYVINFLKKVFNNNNNLTLLEIQKSLKLEFIKNHIQNKNSINKVFIKKI